MLSRPLGRIPLNSFALRKELDFLLHCNEANESYSEFRIGNWRTIVLRTRSAEDAEGLIRPTTNSTLAVAPRAHGLEYINRLVESTFFTERLQLLRAHILEDGVLIPHRDFIELNEDNNRWVRIHLPLQTNEKCLHSEEESVFHMRQGELWILNAAMTHSACNLSGIPRITLCLDFDLAGAQVDSLFRDLAVPQQVDPLIIERDELDAPFLDALYGLGDILNDTNYREILNVLARVHFYKDVNVNAFFSWMVDIAARAGNQQLQRKFSDFAEFLRFNRALGQRFAI